MRTVTTKCSITFLLVLDEQKRHGVLSNTDVIDRLCWLPQARKSKAGVEIHIRQPKVKCFISRRTSKRGFNIRIDARHECEIHAAMVKVGNLFRDTLNLKPETPNVENELTANVQTFKSRQAHVDTIIPYKLPQIYHHHLMHQHLANFNTSSFLRLRMLQSPGVRDWNIKDPKFNLVFDDAYTHQCLLQKIFPSISRAWWYHPRKFANNVVEDISLVVQDESTSGFVKLPTDFYSTLKRVELVKNEILFGKTEVDEHVVLEQSKRELMEHLGRNTSALEGMYDFYQRCVTLKQPTLDYDITQKLYQIIPDEMAVIDDHGTALEVSSLLEATELKKRSMTVIPQLVDQKIPKAPNIQWKFPDFSIYFDQKKWDKFADNVLEGNITIPGHLIVAHIYRQDVKMNFGNRLQLPIISSSNHQADTTQLREVEGPPPKKYRNRTALDDDGVAEADAAVDDNARQVAEDVRKVYTEMGLSDEEDEEDEEDAVVDNEPERDAKKTLAKRPRNGIKLITYMKIHIIRMDVTEDPFELRRIWEAHVEKRVNDPSIYRNLMEWLRDFIIDDANDKFDRWNDESRRSGGLDGYVGMEVNNSVPVKDGWLVTLEKNPLMLEFIPRLERGNIANYIELVKMAVKTDVRAFDKIDHSPFGVSVTDAEAEGLSEAISGLVGQVQNEDVKPIMLNEGFQKWLMRPLLGPAIVKMATFPYNLYTTFASDNEPTNYDTSEWPYEIEKARDFFNKNVIEQLEIPLEVRLEPMNTPNASCRYAREKQAAKLDEHGHRILQNRVSKLKSTTNGSNDADVRPREFYILQNALKIKALPNDMSTGATAARASAPLWWKIYALRAPRWLPKVYEFMQSPPGENELEWNDALPDLLPNKKDMEELRQRYREALTNPMTTSRTTWTLEKIKAAFDRHDQAIYDGVESGLARDLAKAQTPAVNLSTEEDDDPTLQQQSVQDANLFDYSTYNRIVDDMNVLVADLHRGLRDTEVNINQNIDADTQKFKKILYLANHLLGRDLSYYRLSSTLQTPEDLKAAVIGKFGEDFLPSDDGVRALRKEFNDRRREVFYRQRGLGQPEMTIKIKRNLNNPNASITPTASITHPAARAYADDMKWAIQQLMYHLS